MQTTNKWPQGKQHTQPQEDTMSDFLLEEKSISSTVHHSQKISRDRIVSSYHINSLGNSIFDPWNSPPLSVLKFWTWSDLVPLSDAPVALKFNHNRTGSLAYSKEYLQIVHLCVCFFNPSCLFLFCIFLPILAWHSTRRIIKSLAFKVLSNIEFHRDRHWHLIKVIIKHPFRTKYTRKYPQKSFRIPRRNQTVTANRTEFRPVWTKEKRTCRHSKTNKLPHQLRKRLP